MVMMPIQAPLVGGVNSVAIVMQDIPLCWSFGRRLFQGCQL